MNFDFNDSMPLYQQIADQLEEMIFSGALMKVRRYRQRPSFLSNCISILRQFLRG